MTSLAANYLTPSVPFVAVAIIVILAFWGWPLVKALRGGDLAWALVILVTPPLGGLAWYLVKAVERVGSRAVAHRHGV